MQYFSHDPNTHRSHYTLHYRISWIRPNAHGFQNMWWTTLSWDWINEQTNRENNILKSSRLQYVMALFVLLNHITNRRGQKSPTSMSIKCDDVVDADDWKQKHILHIRTDARISRRIASHRTARPSTNPTRHSNMRLGHSRSVVFVCVHVPDYASHRQRIRFACSRLASRISLSLSVSQFVVHAQQCYARQCVACRKLLSRGKY